MGTREIKFRAWDLKHKNYLSAESWMGNYDDLYFGEINAIFGGHKDLVWMQFTGLTDIKGVEIYDGDIIRCYDTAGEIVYDHEVKIPRIYQEIWGNQEDAKCEVIGDIYSTPELLSHA